jgi:hypothetical protein
MRVVVYVLLFFLVKLDSSGRTRPPARLARAAQGDAMSDGGAVLGPKEFRSPAGRRGAIDGLVIGGRDVWILVARPEDDVASMLQPGLDENRSTDLRVCRGVLEGGIVVLGDADPDRDPFLSDLIRMKDGEDRA